MSAPGQNPMSHSWYWSVGWKLPLRRCWAVKKNQEKESESYRKLSTSDFK